MLFTDEACFTRSGILNVHNAHTWADENPRQTRNMRHQHQFLINVWAGIVGDHLFGPNVSKARLTGNDYPQFLREELPVMLEDVPLTVRQKMWFQHDGAPAHYSLRVRRFFTDSYPQRWIGRGGPVAWPPRSPDLNPLDFILWG
jgi:hypothetical protein